MVAAASYAHACRTNVYRIRIERIYYRVFDFAEALNGHVVPESSDFENLVSDAQSSLRQKAGLVTFYKDSCLLWVLASSQDDFKLHAEIVDELNARHASRGVRLFERKSGSQSTREIGVATSYGDSPVAQKQLNGTYLGPGRHIESAICHRMLIGALTARLSSHFTESGSWIPLNFRTFVRRRRQHGSPLQTSPHYILNIDIDLERNGYISIITSISHLLDLDPQSLLVRSRNRHALIVAPRGFIGFSGHEELAATNSVVLFKGHKEQLLWRQKATLWLRNQGISLDGSNFAEHWTSVTVPYSGKGLNTQKSDSTTKLTFVSFNWPKYCCIKLPSSGLDDNNSQEKMRATAGSNSAEGLSMPRKNIPDLLEFALDTLSQGSTAEEVFSSSKSQANVEDGAPDAPYHLTNHKNSSLVGAMESSQADAHRREADQDMSTSTKSNQSTLEQTEDQITPVVSMEGIDHPMSSTADLHPSVFPEKASESKFDHDGDLKITEADLEFFDDKATSLRGKSPKVHSQIPISPQVSTPRPLEDYVDVKIEQTSDESGLLFSDRPHNQEVAAVTVSDAPLERVERPHQADLPGKQKLSGPEADRQTVAEDSNTDGIDSKYIQSGRFSFKVPHTNKKRAMTHADTLGSSKSSLHKSPDTAKHRSQSGSGNGFIHHLQIRGGRAQVRESIPESSSDSGTFSDDSDEHIDEHTDTRESAGETSVGGHEGDVRQKDLNDHIEHKLGWLESNPSDPSLLGYDFYSVITSLRQDQKGQLPISPTKIMDNVQHTTRQFVALSTLDIMYGASSRPSMPPENFDDNSLLGLGSDPWLGDLMRQDTSSLTNIVDSSVFDIEAPSVKVMKGDKAWNLKPTALSFWNTLGLSPLSGPKDIRYYCIYPGGLLAQSLVRRAMDQVEMCYNSYRLGTHKPLDPHKPFLEVPVAEGATIKDRFQSTFRSCVEAGFRIGKYYANPRASAYDAIVIYLVTCSGDVQETWKTCACFTSGITSAQSVPRGKRRSNLPLVMPKIIPHTLIRSSSSAVFPRQAAIIANQIYNDCKSGRFAQNGSDLPIRRSNSVELSVALPNSIPIQLTAYPPQNIWRDRSSLHVAYALSADNDWLVAAWIDNYGQYQHTAVYNTRARDQGDLFIEVWATTLELVSHLNVTWRVLVAKCGSVLPFELRLWSQIFRKSTDEQPKALKVEAAFFSVNTHSPLTFYPDINSSYMNRNQSAFAHPTPRSTSSSAPTPASVVGISSRSPAAAASSPLVPQTPSASVGTPAGFATQNAPSQTHTPSQSGSQHPAPALSQSQSQPQSQIASDPTAELVDMTDQHCGLLLAQPRNISPSLIQVNRALASGLLLRRTGPGDTEKMGVLEVNLMDVFNPTSSNEGGKQRSEGENVEFLREVLVMYRGLVVLGRALSGELIGGHAESVPLGAEAPRPWHVEFVEKAARYLGLCGIKT